MAVLQKICLTFVSYPAVAHNDAAFLQQGISMENIVATSTTASIVTSGDTTTVADTVVPKEPRSPKEFADTVFKYGDTDKNGLLEGKEIKAVGDHLAALEPKAAKVNLSSVDTNGDGKLSHQEVQEAATKATSPASKTGDMTTTAADTVVPKEPRSPKEFADTVFKYGDTNENGLLEGKEIKAVGDHLAALEPKAAKVNVRSVDTNGDAKLSHQEVQSAAAKATSAAPAPKKGDGLNGLCKTVRIGGLPSTQEMCNGKYQITSQMSGGYPVYKSSKNGMFLYWSSSYGGQWQIDTDTDLVFKNVFIHTESRKPLKPPTLAKYWNPSSKKFEAVDIEAKCEE